MNSTLVCRSISLKLEEHDYGYKKKKVVPAPVTDSRVPVASFLRGVVKGKIEHVGRQEMVSVGNRGQPSKDSLFFQGIHKAFAGHHPFALRPEVLMYLINFNVAETVKRHPDDYRALFTGVAKGKEVIEIHHDGLCRGQDSPWHEVLPLFNGKLREKVPAGIMGHMLPGFSTDTPESDAASMVSFMDAASPFYDYRVMTLCGIPEIRLLGTPEDWTKLKNAAAALSEPCSKHLGPYFTNLLPVLATLANQAAGAPQDDEFWSSIYKWKSHSGGPKFDGWISAFLNYIQADGALVEKRAHHFDWRTASLSSGCAPSHISTVPFVWHLHGDEISMSFAGGVLGLDVEDGYLTPALSYAVLEV